MKKVIRNYYSKKDYLFHCIALFFVYGVIGFVLETIYRNIINGKSQMVGFLTFMPILPIYGLMGVVTYIFIRPIENTIEKYSRNCNQVLVAIIVYVIFFTVVSGILELIGGFTLKHVFGSEQWDYSDKPLNYRGYISFVNLIIFSVLGTVNMPLIFYKLDNLIVKYNKSRVVRIILYALVMLLAIDILYTILKYLNIF